MIWHTVRMDEDHLFLRPAKPPQYSERNTTDAGLEFIMEQSLRCAGNWRS
jgi:hypothetical protein